MKCNYLSKDIQKRRFFGLIWRSLIWDIPEIHPFKETERELKDWHLKHFGEFRSPGKTFLFYTVKKKWKLMATSSTSSLNSTSSATSSTGNGSTSGNGQRRYARSSTISVAQLLSDSCNSILQRFRRNPSENKLSASTATATTTASNNNSVAEKRSTNNLR